MKPEVFVGLKAKNIFILNEYEKAKSVNENVVAGISHNEYKDVLLNKKYIKHSINRIQNKDYRIGTYEINKILVAYFDDKMHIQNNQNDGLVPRCKKQLSCKKQLYFFL